MAYFIKLHVSEQAYEITNIVTRLFSSLEDDGYDVDNIYLYTLKDGLQYSFTIEKEKEKEKRLLSVYLNLPKEELIKERFSSVILIGKDETGEKIMKMLAKQFYKSYWVDELADESEWLEFGEED